MPDKRKLSPAEAIIDIASLLPWWLCIGLGAVSYFALHAYAASPNAPIVPGHAASSVVPIFLKGLATAGQYILPILLGFAALLSFIKRVKSGSQQAGVTTSISPKATSATGTPSCPVCASPMVIRKAKKGANAGNEFWGCTNYPQCKGTKTAS